MFEASAPNYQNVDGLRRKHFLLSDDGRTAGGVYLWDSREQAEALYDEAWRSPSGGTLRIRAARHLLRQPGHRRPVVDHRRLSSPHLELWSLAGAESRLRTGSGHATKRWRN